MNAQTLAQAVLAWLDVPTDHDGGGFDDLEALARAALSTPPADDVREAFTNGWYSARQNPGIAAATHSPDFPGEVRPRGTVTDAERVRVLEEFLRYNLLPDAVREYMSGYVEAAREVRS